MKRAATYSAILHVIIFILLTVGFYNPFRKTLAEQKPMMIEFVNIADVSLAPVLAPEEMLDPEPMQDVTPEEQPAPEQPQPEPKPEPKPEVKPEVAPEPPKPEPKPDTKPAPEPEAVPVPAAKPIEPKKEEPKQEQKQKPDKVEVNLDKKEEKPKPKEIDKKEKKKIDDDFASLLNETAPKKKDKAKVDGKVKGAPADKVGEVVTANEIDAIRQRISRCWIVPNGARGARDMVVDVNMKIGKDGTVLDAKIADKSRMNSDPAFRAAAESARRAVMDPNCNPLPLNPAKFEQWKELTLSFNPKDMY